MTNPKYKYPNKYEVEFSTDQIGKVFTTNSEPLYFEKLYRNNFDPDDYTAYVGKMVSLKQGTGNGGMGMENGEQGIFKMRNL